MKKEKSTSNKNTTLTVRVSTRIKELFDLYCEQEGVLKKHACTKALEGYLKVKNFIK